MNRIQKSMLLGMIIVLAGITFSLFPGHVVSAVAPDSSQPLCFDNDGSGGQIAHKVDCTSFLVAGKCYIVTPGAGPQGSTKYEEKDCASINYSGGTGSGNFTADCTDPNVDKSNCGIIRYLVTFINVLSGLVGIIIVAIITFRGVQYTFSRDNPQIVAQARDGIRDAVFALVYFLLIFAFLQWLVPGGIF